MRETSRFWSKLLSYNIYPKSLRTPLYTYFARVFDADVNECEHGPDHLDHYANFGEFFRRNLKPGVRPIDSSSPVVSPCDGEILANGLVTSVDQLTLVIKGVPYTIKDLFQFDQYEIDLLKEKQSKSSLFYTCIYLNPGNYHHFHSPAKWRIRERRHITGELMSVRPEFILWIPNLLLLNERVVYLGDYQYGLMTQTMIGATNVGSIDIYFDRTLKTNQKSDDYTFRMWTERFLPSASDCQFDKGDAFGEFKLGSCIVLVFEGPSNFRFDQQIGDKIRIVLFSVMAPPTDPADFSKLRSVQPMNSDPDAPPASMWQKVKHTLSMLVEVTKNKPISETVCMKEALILGIPGSFLCSMAAFLFSTNRIRVFQTAIISMPILTMGRFTQCRAAKEHERKATILVSKMVKAKMLTDGTAKQGEFERLFKKSRVELVEFERELDAIITQQQTGRD